MRNERIKAAHEVAEQLFAVEEALDGALSNAGTLTIALSKVRREANLAATVGQEAIEEVAGAVAALAKARRHIVTAHLALDETKTQIGLRTLNFGTGGGKPEEERGSLSLVRTYAA